MLARLGVLLSESVANTTIPDHMPLQLDELQPLISMAAESGYTIKNARNMVPPPGVISSELYAVWYSIEHEIPIYSDNIENLINMTGWKRSSPQDSDAPVHEVPRTAFGN
jgi:hypothetical protein